MIEVCTLYVNVNFKRSSCKKDNKHTHNIVMKGFESCNQIND